MKKSLIILALCLTAASFAAQAQTTTASARRKYFEFGPKFGLSVPTLNATTNTVEVDKLLNGFNTGFQLGGFARGMLPVGKQGVTLYLQTEALYAMDFYYGRTDAHAMSGYFNFPVLAGGGYRFKNGTFLRGGWGAMFSVNLFQSATTVYEGYEPQLCTLLKRDAVGHVADLGVDFKNLSIDLRYQNQFRSLTSYPRVVDSARYISWGLTIGYRF